MRIGWRKLKLTSINIRKIVEYLGNDVAAKLSQIHTVTGYDTTSFHLLLGKPKFLKSVSMKKKISGF